MTKSHRIAWIQAIYLFLKEIIFLPETFLSDCLGKEKNYGPVRKRGGGQPQSATKIYIFFLIREKRSRKFWNEKICILMKFEKYVFISDYSGSLDKNIEKDIKKSIFFLKVRKKRFLRTGEKGSERYWQVRNF